MPITAGAVIAGVQGVKAIVNWIGSSKKKKQADALEKQNQRPTSTTPQAILDNVAEAKIRAQEGLKPSQKQQAKQAIQRGAATAIRGAKDRQGGLAAISAIQQNTADSELNLAVADDQAQAANQQNLQQQNQVLAGYEKQNWVYNQAKKFEENAAAIRALRGAAAQDSNSAWNSAISGVAGGISDGVFNKWLGKKDNTTTDPTMDSNMFQFNGFPTTLAEYLRKKAAYGGK